LRPSIEEVNVKPFSTEALFRYQVVSLVRARMLGGVRRVTAVAEVAGLGHATSEGELRKVCARSVYRWLAAYERDGFGGLEDKPRKPGSTSRVLPARLLEFLAESRKKDRDASIPELLGRAVEHGILSPSSSVDRTTVFRALVRLGVATARTKKARDRDMRSFAYEHRMELVLADGKHFRAGASRAKRVAFFFLDDATRLGLNVVVGTSESAPLFLRGFHETLRAHGRLGILYLDHGPGFVATAVAEVCRHFEIALVHGESRYPEGHGKVERFNQTVGKAVLRGLDGRADVDPTCAALELRLRHWLYETYNQTPHEGLPGVSS
jgi:transposase InsO family protein